MASNATNFDAIHEIASFLKNLLHFMLCVAQGSMLMPQVGVSSRSGMMIHVLALPRRHHNGTLCR
jgi:hypothetical protein